MLQRSGELHSRVVFVEEALSKALNGNGPCHPRKKQNKFVLEVRSRVVNNYLARRIICGEAFLLLAVSTGYAAINGSLMLRAC